MCANYDFNIDELFRTPGWLKLKYQRFESAAIMKYKSIHGMTPEYLSSRFVFQPITTYNPVTFGQHVYMILNVTYVTTVLNEF